MRETLEQTGVLVRTTGLFGLLDGRNYGDDGAGPPTCALITGR